MNFDRDVAFSNKIRIIDLLNKIANGEEVPKEVFYQKQWWKYNPNNDYEGTEWGGCLLNNICLNELNDEVEIIEEDKEIEKIELDGEYIVTYTTGIRQLMNTNKKDRDIYIKKINQLIDKVNSLENKQ